MNEVAAKVDEHSSATGSYRVPSPITTGYRRYAMGVLLAISIVNYLDRQIVYILAEPIKNDLRLADSQLGILTGLAFGLLYTVLGLPIARLAERGHRPRIIAVAAAVWSSFTILCGFATSFVHLALARVGVGVGEAGCAPASNSLIMDYTPPAKRSSALAIYGLGSAIGGLFGMALGGLIANAFGWRAAFLVAGFPGLILALIAALTLREPRPTKSRREAKREPGGTLADMYRLVKPKRSYLPLAVAITAFVFVLYGSSAFLGSFFLRNHGAALDEAAEAIGGNIGALGFLGLALGITSGVCGGMGTWLGGLLSDRLGVRDARSFVYLPAVAALLCVPLLVAMLTVHSVWLALAFLGLQALVSGFWYGPAYTAWFSLVPANMRATNSALNLFLANLVGLGLAPITVGIISDAVAASAGPAAGIRWALIALSSVWVVAALFFAIAARTFREDMEV